MKYLYLLLILPLMLTVSCKKDPGEPPVPKTAERTVLVYMCASNSLGASGFDNADIAEMLAGAGQIPADGRLVVYHHAPSQDPVLIQISAEGTDTLASYSPGDISVSATQMSRVIADTKRLAPARQYGLVLWSHGSGWLEDGINEDAGDITPQSFGDDRSRKMNITTLANVLEGKGFDWIYFDCCYMASVETLYQLRRCARTAVASATELPANGMPYDQNIPCFFASGEADLVAAAENTFRHYDSLSGQGRTCTISVTDLGKMDDLADAVRSIYSQARSSYPEGYVPQKFMTVGQSACWYFDLGHYVHALGAEAGADVSAFDQALDNCVVYRAATPRLWDQIALNAHCGLSTYILTSSQSASKKGYDSLEWYQNIASRLPLK